MMLWISLKFEFYFNHSHIHSVVLINRLSYPGLNFLSHDRFTGCNLTELWNLPAVGVTFLPDVSLLNDAVHYASCGADSVGSAVLVNNTLNTATVAYYTGTTPGSRACFVCEEGYELNTTTNERVCQRNGLWSGNPIVCGALAILWCTCKRCSMLILNNGCMKQFVHCGRLLKLITLFCLLNPCCNRVQTATMDYSSGCDGCPCPVDHTYWCHSHNHWWHHWLFHSIEKAQAKHRRLLQWY